MLRKYKEKLSLLWLKCIGVFCMILKIISVYLSSAQSAFLKAALLANILLNSLRKYFQAKFTQGNDAKCWFGVCAGHKEVRFINPQGLCEIM